MGSTLKNNVVQAGLVFDVVLYLPSISRWRCLMNTEILGREEVDFILDENSL